MRLTTRISAFLLALLAVVLVGFSAALYLSVWVYLNRQLDDRVTSSLETLAAAAEIFREGVEWEPAERELPIGLGSGVDRSRWMVQNDKGVRIDQSRNWDDSILAATTAEDGRTIPPPSRVLDTHERPWRIAHRRLVAGTIENRSGSYSAASPPATPAPVAEPDSILYPSLLLTVVVSLEPMEGTFATLRWLLIGLSTGVWLMAAVSARWLSRRALAPLTRMAASAKGLDARDEGWSLDLPRTNDELTELGQAFNGLLARLHLAYELKRRFSSEASHQLRTPLTVLIGQLDVTLRRPRSQEEYRQVLKTLHSRALELNQIVESLLFLGRSESEILLLDATHLELSDWLRNRLTSRAGTGASASRSADIQLEVRDSPIWVSGQALLLAQLVDNLIENACKYSKPGTPIVVRVERSDAAACVAIRDSGIGISIDEQMRVFEPFFRSWEAKRLGISGHGLGLTVVQRIAKSLGGNISVDSEVGKGSTFTLRLPLVHAPGRSDPSLMPDSASPAELVESGQA
jgi:signal transduction histidine kinase